MSKPQLSLVVNPETGEVTEGCPHCAEKDDVIEGLKTKIAAAAGQLTRAKNESARLMAVEASHDDILDVMVFWRDRLCPKARIVVGSKGWRTVRARLSEQDAETGRQFTPVELKGAIVGMTFDPWHMDSRHRHRRYLENAFADAGKVDRLIGWAVHFKRTYGASALELVDELAGDSLKWLAERCECGHFRLDHVKRGVTPDGRQPCEGQTRDEQTGMPVPCPCDDFDWFTAKFEMYMVELKARAAEGDPDAVRELEESEWYAATQAEWRRNRDRKDAELRAMVDGTAEE